MRKALVTFMVCAAASSASAGIDPCVGISGVHPTDPNLVGDLTTIRVASGLSSPVHVAFAPNDNQRMFVVEQVGRIRVVNAGVLQATPFLDIQTIVNFGGEQGLLSMAFDPNYQSNGHFFVYHTDNSGNQRIARYTRQTALVADPASGVTVLTVPHPSFANHNGGQLAFGRDGALYVATGDGGAGCDPGPGVGNGQSLDTLLGKLLRLRVDTLPYNTIGNPFDGATPGLDEIWSYGLRNPYTFTVDRETGNFYIGDVGQNVLEEIDCGASPTQGGGGENYGWVNYEGSQCPNPSCGDSGTCALADHVPPFHEYNQSGTPCSVISGYAYRGCRMPELNGTYFYSDFCSAFLRTLRLPEDGTCPSSPINAFVDRTADLAPDVAGQTIGNVSSFGEDNFGEIYIVDAGGEVFQVVPNLSIMEVSGPGALPFQMRGPWVFENLDRNTPHVLESHKFYRSSSATGPFSCIVSLGSNVCSNATCRWSTGDTEDPDPDDAFFYLVTSLDGNGNETTAGAASDGTVRVVDTGSACP